MGVQWPCQPMEVRSLNCSEVSARRTTLARRLDDLCQRKRSKIRGIPFSLVSITPKLHKDPRSLHFSFVVTSSFWRGAQFSTLIF